MSQIGLTSIVPGGRRDLRRHLDGLVEVLAIDESSRQLFLRFGEGPVGGQHLALAELDRGGVGGGPQALAALEHAPGTHFLAEGGVLGHHGGALIGAHGPYALSSVEIISRYRMGFLL